LSTKGTKRREIYTYRSNAGETVKVLIISGKYSLSDATVFKPVILAWMPESSAMNGNYMIIK